MASCTFFGHKAVPDAIEPALRSVLTDLVENGGADLFYVGGSGGFDRMVHRVLMDAPPVRLLGKREAKKKAEA